MPLSTERHVMMRPTSLVREVARPGMWWEDVRCPGEAEWRVLMFPLLLPARWG